MKRFYILFAFVLIVTAGLTVAAQNQQNQHPRAIRARDRRNALEAESQ